MKSFRAFHESTDVPKVAGKTAAEWARVIGDLRDKKPRPLDKLYGSKGPTPEQKTEWDAKMRAWTSEYRKASKNQKEALDLQNRTWKPTMQEDAPVNAAGNGGIAGIGVGPKGEPGVNLKKKKKVVDPLEEDIDLSKQEEDVAAKAVHDRWMDYQKDQGHTSHKSPDGKEEYMKDYEKLSEPAKDLDRMAVQAVVTAINQLQTEAVESPSEPETFAGARVFEVGMDQWMQSRFGKNRYHKYAKYVGTDEVGEEIRSFGRTSNDDIVLKDSATAVMTFLRRKSRGNV